MKEFLAPFGFLAVFLIGGWVYRRFLAIEPEPSPELRMPVGQLPKLFRAIKTTGAEGSFAGVSVPPQGSRDPNESAYVQFSVEGGRVGFDWVLLSPQNLDDQSRFAAIARQLGHTIEEREMNDVRYLRVEDGDLPQLAATVLKQLYGVRARDSLLLQVEGLEWARPAAV